MNTKFNGSPINLCGALIRVGDHAPDFKMAKSDLSNFWLSETSGRKVVLNIFPSIDTSVCAMSVRRFNKIAAENPDTMVLCISKDLSFAQRRFCAAEGLQNVITLSDCRPASQFGQDYGVLMTSGVLDGLFARSVVVISQEGRVVYATITPDITKEPDYDAVIKALQRL